MGEPWSDIVAHLRGQRLLAPQSLQERLLGLADPKSVIEAATALNMSGGMLTATMLDDMIAHANGATAPAAPQPSRPDPVRQVPDDLADADFAISVTGIAGPTNEGSKKPVGTVYVGIASHTGWANAIRTQIGGTRAENKAGFVYFALLTAMKCWDDAMRRIEQDEQDQLDAAAEALRLEEERKAEQERRDQAAREQAPWQDEAWSEDQDSEEIGLEVEWTESEE